MNMVDILYGLNSRLGYNGSIFDKWKFKGIIRRVVYWFANIALPIYYTIISPKKKNLFQVPIIISFTSFPVRIGRVWLTVESMLRQTHRPQLIILWLSRQQFPDGVQSLPLRLQKQMTRGLEVRFVDGDIRSFKKFYYSFDEFRKSKIVTIDDDLIFPTYFVSKLYKLSLKYPNSIIANYGFGYTWDNVQGYISKNISPVSLESPSTSLFFGSGGGTLFNVRDIIPYMDNIRTILRLCPTADDIYLNAIVRLAGQTVVFMSNNPLLSVYNPHDKKLVNHNGGILCKESNNGKQLLALCEYMVSKHGVHPFGK